MRVHLFRRALVFALIVACFAPAQASAASRMWAGFQDDQSFRWVDDRATLLDDAQAANATVIRATVYWSKVAPRRPASAADPFDPAYRFTNLDDTVRAAQQRGIEVMLTVWGTPRWAGPGQNKVPRRLSDFQNFTRALAARYSGRYPGYPFVRFFSIWNEPNRGLFLSPQFSSRGKPLAPALYAKLVRAGYAGVKGGNRDALVAMGETASNGRDRPVTRKDARVQMFIWFILADRPGVPWQSGLLTASGNKKYAYATFASLARSVDARNAIVEVREQDPLVRFSTLPMAYYEPIGSEVGVWWEL